MLILKRFTGYAGSRYIVPAVLIVTVVLFASRVYLEPQTLESSYGVQSQYSISYYDVSNPFTVYYVQHGTDASNHTGNIQFSGTSATLTNSSGTLEWTFPTDKFLSAVNHAGSSITTATILVSEPSPTSPDMGGNISISVNGVVANRILLDRQVNSLFTISAPSQYNIPGSNSLLPVQFAVFNITQTLQEILGKNPIQVSLEMAGTISWNLDVVALQLYSDYTTATTPWWSTHIWSLLAVIPVAGLGLVGVFYYARRSLMKYVEGKHIRGVTTALILGLIARLALAPFFQGFTDVDTYRNAAIVSYYFGLDTRSFLSICGSLWHAITLAFFPLSFLYQPFLGSIWSENLAVKTPLIVADLMTALALLRIGTTILTPRAGRLLMIGWLLNPYSIWMTGWWGILHPIAAAFLIVAIERIVHKRFFTGGVLLISAVFASLALAVVVPSLLLLMRRRGGLRIDSGEFNRFILGICGAAIPLFFLWDFSIAIFHNILFGAGRFGADSLSPSFILTNLLHGDITATWNAIGIPAGLLALYVWQFSRTKNLDRDKSKLLDHALAPLLVLYSTALTVYPTYIMWSLPLMSLTVLRRVVRFGYYAMFQVFPAIWTVTYLWNSALDIPYASIRVACDLGFSFCLILILVFVVKNIVHPLNLAGPEILDE